MEEQTEKGRQAALGEANQAGALRQEILAGLDFSREWSDEEIEEEIERQVLKLGRREYLSPTLKKRLCRELFNSLRRLDLLQELLEDPQISEIMVNGPKHIFVEKEGRLLAWEGELESEERLEDIIQQIVSKVNRVVNEAHPVVDARLEDGSRINAVLPPIALDGAALTIRKFSAVPYDMARLTEQGSICEEAVSCMRQLVRSGYNIIISGGTGSGKTTFLNALSGYIQADERVITIEDSAELQIQGLKNLVRLEMRLENVEGKGAVTMRDLIKTALRMRPDRLVIGEVRDGGAALDMLIAMNTGHDGSLTTIHSNSAADCISRLETLVLTEAEMPLAAVRRQIVSAVDLIVHLGRLRDRSRKVLEIAEVCGMKEGEVELNPLFQWEEKEAGSLTRTGNRLRKRDKLERQGVLDEEISI